MDKRTALDLVPCDKELKDKAFEVGNEIKTKFFGAVSLQEALALAFLMGTHYSEHGYLPKIEVRSRN